MGSETTVQSWGLLAYSEAMQRQQNLLRARMAGTTGDTIVCVEHPPTITLGRHTPESDLLVDREVLRKRGVAVVKTERGGRATYHGPGQAVIYPIVDIRVLRLGVRAWVALLEGVIIETLADYEIKGNRHANAPGVWTNDRKIASIGLRIRRGISTHGLAINVDLADLDVRGFEDIVTCGVAHQAITTMTAECGHRVGQEAVSALLCKKLIAAIEGRTRT